MTSVKNGEVRITARSRTDLSRQYGVCLNTFNGWLKELLPELHRSRKSVFTPAQVKQIFEKLGEP